MKREGTEAVVEEEILVVRGLDWDSNMRGFSGSNRAGKWCSNRRGD